MSNQESFEIIPTKQFEKDIRHYKHKLHYYKIDDDIDEVIVELEKGNFVGDEIAELCLPDSESVFKVRAVNSSANVGKSNGFRLIYYVVKNEYEVYLLTIYSKKEQESITQKEIVMLIKKYCL